MPSRLSSTNKTKWALSWRLRFLCDVDGELGEKLERLAPLVGRIDRQGALEQRQRFGVTALIKFYPRVEIERFRRFRVFFQLPRGKLLGFGDAPSVEQFFAGLELGIGLGARTPGPPEKAKAERRRKTTIGTSRENHSERFLK